MLNGFSFRIKIVEVNFRSFAAQESKIKIDVGSRPINKET